MRRKQYFCDDCGKEIASKEGGEPVQGRDVHIMTLDGVPYDYCTDCFIATVSPILSVQTFYKDRNGNAVNEVKNGK